MKETQLIDGSVLISASDTWCKTSGLQKFVGLGSTKIREHAAMMEASGKYDDKIIIYPGMRLINAGAFIEYLQVTQSVKALKKMRKRAQTNKCSGYPRKHTKR